MWSTVRRYFRDHSTHGVALAKFCRSQWGHSCLCLQLVPGGVADFDSRWNFADHRFFQSTVAEKISSCLNLDHRVYWLSDPSFAEFKYWNIALRRKRGDTDTESSISSALCVAFSFIVIAQFNWLQIHQIDSKFMCPSGQYSACSRHSDFKPYEYRRVPLLFAKVSLSRYSSCIFLDNFAGC